MVIAVVPPFGSAALMASMLLDGLVIPAVAARFVDIEAPEKLAADEAVFVLCGTLISFLMSGGLAFQSVAMLSLAGLLFAGPPRRPIPGAIGLVAGTLLIVLLTAPAHMATHAPGGHSGAGCGTHAGHRACSAGAATVPALKHAGTSTPCPGVLNVLPRLRGSDRKERRMCMPVVYCLLLCSFARRRGAATEDAARSCWGARFPHTHPR
jgi:hypothetical protein